VDVGLDHVAEEIDETKNKKSLENKERDLNL